MTSSPAQDGPDAMAVSLDRRFRSPLISYFGRRIGNRAEAEDLTQEVFVRILAAAERGPIENAEALVFVTAGNLLKDRSRRARNHGHIDIDKVEKHHDARVAGEFSEDRDPERVLLGKESVADMLAALDELGERTRDIFILFRLENMKQKEIAALFNIGRSTVEKEVMRATLHLAKRFGRSRK